MVAEQYRRYTERRNAAQEEPEGIQAVAAEGAELGAGRGRHRKQQQRGGFMPHHSRVCVHHGRGEALLW